MKTPNNNGALFCVFHGQGGYAREQEESKKHLTIGDSYRVNSVEIHRSITNIYLDGVEHSWSSGMFDVDFHCLRKMGRRNTTPRTGDTFVDPDEGEMVVTGQAIGGVMARSVSGHIGDHYVSFTPEETEDDED